MAVRLPSGPARIKNAVSEAKCLQGNTTGIFQPHFPRDVSIKKPVASETNNLALSAYTKSIFEDNNRHLEQYERSTLYRIYLVLGFRTTIFGILIVCLFCLGHGTFTAKTKAGPSFEARPTGRGKGMATAGKGMMSCSTRTGLDVNCLRNCIPGWLADR